MQTPITSFKILYNHAYPCFKLCSTTFQCFNSFLLSTVIPAEVQFDQILYGTIEGTNARLRIVLTGPSRRDVTVEVSTRDGTAQGIITMSVRQILYIITNLKLNVVNLAL